MVWVLSRILLPIVLAVIHRVVNLRDLGLASAGVS